MLDTLVESEGHADLLQISGGEPTLHPQIIDILKMAKDRPIRHLMLVTNGRRIAEDQDFVKSLKQFSPGFEIYLQFDSLDNNTLKTLRGEELLEVRNRALRNLELVDISTTLVCTVQKGVNDSEADAIIKKALSYRMVRGVAFQPVQFAGRNDQFDINANRILLSEIRAKIAQGSNAFGEEDLIPLPCHPEAISIEYALREGANITPITSIIPIEEILESAKASISGVLWTIANSPSLLMRKENAIVDIQSFAGFVIDKNSRTVKDEGGDFIDLTRTEFDLLSYFLERRNQALTRDDILNGVWGVDVVVDYRTVDNFVSNLKRKLKWSDKSRFQILTIRGVGYRFELGE